MDKLMVGYGVTNSDKTPSSVNSGQLAIMSDPAKVKAPPKKELTLLEKQQLASQFDSIDGSMSGSFSMQNLKKTATPKTNTDLLADNLMNSNLANLGGSGLSGSKSFSKPMSLQPSSMNNSQMSNQKNNLNYNSNDFFSQFNTPVSSNSFNQSNNMMSNSNSGNMGFFGNLALGPAPPGNKSGFNSVSMNPPMTSSLSQMGNMNNNINILTPNKPNGQQNKKTALDDLDDLFG